MRRTFYEQIRSSLQLTNNEIDKDLPTARMGQSDKEQQELDNNIINVITKLQNKDPTLTKLDLASDQFSDEYLASNLIYLRLNQSLKGNTYLKEIYLMDVGMIDDHCIILVEPLSTCTSLLVLNLEFNLLTSRSMIAISTMAENSSINELILANQISEEELPSRRKGEEALANMLSQNTNIHTLTYDFKHDDIITHINNYLERNKPIKTSATNRFTFVFRRSSLVEVKTPYPYPTSAQHYESNKKLQANSVLTNSSSHENTSYDYNAIYTNESNTAGNMFTLSPFTTEGRENNGGGNSPRATLYQSQTGTPNLVRASFSEHRSSRRLESVGNAAAPMASPISVAAGPGAQFNSTKCTKCSKKVFPIEKLEAAGGVWHRHCFCCGATGAGGLGCGQELSLTTFVVREDVPYCGACYVFNFEPKTGFVVPVTASTPASKPVADSVAGSKLAGSDKAVGLPRAGDDRASRVPFSTPTTSPTSVAAGPGAQFNSTKCTKCSKKVFPIEKLEAAGGVWHRHCFSCGATDSNGFGCGKELSLATFVNHNDVPFCGACYVFNFEPKTGFVMPAGAPTPAKKSAIPGQHERLALPGMVADPKADEALSAGEPMPEPTDAALALAVTDSAVHDVSNESPPSPRSDILKPELPAASPGSSPKIKPTVSRRMSVMAKAAEMKVPIMTKGDQSTAAEDEVVLADVVANLAMEAEEKGPALVASRRRSVVAVPVAEGSEEKGPALVASRRRSVVAVPVAEGSEEKGPALVASRRRSLLPVPVAFAATTTIPAAADPNALESASPVSQFKSTACVSCSKKVFPIERVEAAGGVWHRHCFICGATGANGVGCGQELSVTKYVARGDVPYCAACNIKHFEPKTGFVMPAFVPDSKPEPKARFSLTKPVSERVTTAQSSPVVGAVPPATAQTATAADIEEEQPMFDENKAKVSSEGPAADKELAAVNEGNKKFVPLAVVSNEAVVVGPVALPVSAASSGSQFKSAACVSCSKKVFPIERVEAAGGVWHRHCFICGATDANGMGCGQELSLTKYVARGDVPYCAACNIKHFEPKSAYVMPVFVPAAKPEPKSRPATPKFMSENAPTAQSSPVVSAAHLAAAATTTAEVAGVPGGDEKGLALAGVSDSAPVESASFPVGTASKPESAAALNIPMSDEDALERSLSVHTAVPFVAVLAPLDELEEECPTAAADVDEAPSTSEHAAPSFAGLAAIEEESPTAVADEGAAQVSSEASAPIDAKPITAEDEEGSLKGPALVASRRRSVASDLIAGAALASEPASPVSRFKSTACVSCSKKVFPIERVEAAGGVWHRHCFSCGATDANGVGCGQELSVTNFVARGDVPYCAACNIKHFEPKSAFVMPAFVPSPAASGPPSRSTSPGYRRTTGRQASEVEPAYELALPDPDEVQDPVPVPVPVSPPVARRRQEVHFTPTLQALDDEAADRQLASPVSVQTRIREPNEPVPPKVSAVTAALASSNESVSSAHASAPRGSVVEAFMSSKGSTLSRVFSSLPDTSVDDIDLRASRARTIRPGRHSVNGSYSARPETTVGSLVAAAAAVSAKTTNQVGRLNINERTQEASSPHAFDLNKTKNFRAPIQVDATTEINIRGQDLSSDKLGYFHTLASRLNKNTTIEDIFLINVHMRDDHCLILMNVLPTCTSLKKLNIESNKLTAVGLLAIANLIKVHPSLEEIRFDNQRSVGDRDVERELVAAMNINTRISKLSYTFKDPTNQNFINGFLKRNSELKRMRRRRGDAEVHVVRPGEVDYSAFTTDVLDRVDARNSIGMKRQQPKPFETSYNSNRTASPPPVYSLSPHVHVSSEAKSTTTTVNNNDGVYAQRIISDLPTPRQQIDNGTTGPVSSPPQFPSVIDINRVNDDDDDGTLTLSHYTPMPLHMQKYSEASPALKTMVSFRQQPMTLEEVLVRLRSKDTAFTHVNLNNTPNLTSDDFQTLASALQHNKNITGIELSNVAMTDDQLKLILPSLQTCPQLQKLSIESNYLNFPGFLALAAFIEGSESLRELRIANQHSPSTKYMEKLIANALSQNFYVTKLSYDTKDIWVRHL